MLTRISAIMKKEFIQILRDPRTLGIVLVFPVMAILLFGYAITFEIKNVPTAIYAPSYNQVSKKFFDNFTNSGYFTIKYYAKNYGEIEQLFSAGLIKAAIVLPPDFAKKIKGRQNVAVQIIVDGADANSASVIIGYTGAITQRYLQEEVLKTVKGVVFPGRDSYPPITVYSRMWYNPELKSHVFIVPGLIVVVLMMVSAVLTSMTIVRERERGTMEQLLISPMKPVELMIGKIVPYVIICYIDVLFIVLVSNWAFKLTVAGSSFLLIFLTSFFLLGSLGIGLAVSSITETQQTAMLLAYLLSMIPSLVLSGFIFPISSMPQFIQAITYLMPARYFMVITRGIYLKGVGFDVLWPQALFLLIFGSLLILISAKRFKTNLE